MIFKGACIILLIGILVGIIFILAFLIRNIIREFKNEIQTQLDEGLLPLMKQFAMLNQEIPAMHRKLDDLLFPSPPIPYPTHTDVVGCMPEIARAGESIHVFTNGEWRLHKDLSTPGYEASKPAMKGTFDGQVVKTVSKVAKN